MATIHLQEERSLSIVLSLVCKQDVTQCVLSRVFAGGFHNLPACLANFNMIETLPRTGIESRLNRFAFAGCEKTMNIRPLAIGSKFP